MNGRQRFLWLRCPALPLLLLLVQAGCTGAVAEPSILFLRQVDGRAQLFRQSGTERPAQQLTDPSAELEVIDFSTAPDGSAISYSAYDGSGGSVIRMLSPDGRGDRTVLECPSEECSGATWSPDGRRLIYERRSLINGRAGPPRLYWLDPSTGATLPLIDGNETPGYGPRFSPDGLWLSYVSMRDEGIVLYRLTDGQQRLVSGRSGRPAAWSADSVRVVVSDLAFLAEPAGVGQEGAESSAVFLYAVEVADQDSRQQLSPAAAVDDSAAAWSPDGEWIAFGRVWPETGAGRQLWLMRSDGSEARPLSDEPGYSHGPPAWSPDGRFLLYQRFDLTGPGAVPEVRRLTVETGEEIALAADAYLPAWLPAAP